MTVLSVTLWMWTHMMSWKLQLVRENGQGVHGQLGNCLFICLFSLTIIHVNWCVLIVYITIHMHVSLWKCVYFLMSFSIWWRSDKDELRVKEETGATIRCFPFEQPEGRNKACLLTGNPAEEVAIFAKSYWITRHELTSIFLLFFFYSGRYFV